MYNICFKVLRGSGGGVVDWYNAAFQGNFSTCKLRLKVPSHDSRLGSVPMCDNFLIIVHNQQRATCVYMCMSVGSLVCWKRRIL